MTANDAATLLRTYANALETVHPVPADQTDLARLIPTLEDDSTPTLDISLTEAPAPPGIGRLAAVALALAAAIAVLVGYALLNDDSDVRTGDENGSSPFVFEGETVVREDPLVVIAARPEEPNFDTSELGTRIVFGPIDLEDEELDAAIDDEIRRLETPLPPLLVESQIRKVSLLWAGELRPKTVGVVDWTSDIAIGGTPPGSPVRVRGSNMGVTVDVNDPSESFLPPRTLSELLERQGDTRVRFISGLAEGAGGSIDLEASLDIAVLQLVVDGKSMWAVPIDGLAVFPADLLSNTSIEIVAFDVNGVEVARNSTTMAEL